MAKQLYLQKHNDQLISHCACAVALITASPQMDCPWCGCGWLFTCITCRKAFTFAKAVETHHSLEELAQQDLAGRGNPVAKSNIDQWVKSMQFYLREVQLGHSYVTFDSRLIDTSQKAAVFDGIHSTHDLPFVPQVQALQDAGVINQILANESYWESHAITDFSPSALGKPVVRDKPAGSWWKRLFRN